MLKMLFLLCVFPAVLFCTCATFVNNDVILELVRSWTGEASATGQASAIVSKTVEDAKNILTATNVFESATRGVQCNVEREGGSLAYECEAKRRFNTITFTVTRHTTNTIILKDSQRAFTLSNEDFGGQALLVACALAKLRAISALRLHDGDRSRRHIRCCSIDVKKGDYKRLTLLYITDDAVDDLKQLMYNIRYHSWQMHSHGAMQKMASNHSSNAMFANTTIHTVANIDHDDIKCFTVVDDQGNALYECIVSHSLGQDSKIKSFNAFRVTRNTDEGFHMKTSYIGGRTAAFDYRMYGDHAVVVAMAMAKLAATSFKNNGYKTPNSRNCVQFKGLQKTTTLLRQNDFETFKTIVRVALSKAPSRPCNPSRRAFSPPSQRGCASRQSGSPPTCPCSQPLQSGGVPNETVGADSLEVIAAAHALVSLRAASMRCSTQVEPTVPKIYSNKSKPDQVLPRGTVPTGSQVNGLHGQKRRRLA